jgi:hypothetical protein
MLNRVFDHERINDAVQTAFATDHQLVNTGVKLQSKPPSGVRPQPCPGKPAQTIIGPQRCIPIPVLTEVIFELGIPLNGGQPRPFSLYV